MLQAINALGVAFGAELASARAQIEALTVEVASLKGQLTALPPPPVKFAHMPLELAGMQPISSYELDLIKSNKKIDAIKAYRMRVETTFGKHVGLKEAKDLIVYIADHLGYEKPLFDPAKPVPMTDHQKDLVHAGKKIDAIKDYRQHVGQICASMCGLKEAKDVIDAYAAELQAKVATVPPAEPPLLPSESQYLTYVPGQGIEGKFECVKAYRLRTGCTLAQAMNAVDEYVKLKTEWIGYKVA